MWELPVRGGFAVCFSLNTSTKKAASEKQTADFMQERKEVKPMPYEKETEMQYELICQQCGKTFFHSCKSRKYCSRECSHAARRTGPAVYKKVCPQCGKEYETIYKNQTFCCHACSADAVRGEYFCEYCGKPRYSDHPNRNRFCSRECARKAKLLKGEAKRNQKLLKKLQWEEERQRVCEYCGKAYVANCSNQKYCSKECGYEGNKRLHRKKYVDAYEASDFYCAECGKHVVLHCGDTRSVYCSEECGVKAMRRIGRKKYNQKRKEQMEDAYVEPVGIKETYHKYKGICAICGLPVPATSEPTSVWAATRDHVVPLSKGGLHEKDNVQLAHRMCNSMKLDAVNGFSIDWSQKLVDEPGRWNERLDELWDQLGVIGERAAEVG